MNQKFDEKLWERVLAEIETEVSKANFLTLFKNTSLVSFEQDTVTIAAPSTMIIDLIQKRFYDLIKKSVDSHTGVDSKIIFVPKVIVKEPSEDGPLFEIAPKKLIGHLPRVRPDYTFQNMAVSSSNQLAYVSAKTVSEKIGGAYNPLFIYGPVGVGKTHLMQAIANEVYLKDPSFKVIYITSEEFTNEVVDAIRTNNTSNMKRKFRSATLFLLDDVQFLAGKERVQEELFHTFNILLDAGSQIVLSSDKPPADLKKMERRLVSRFGGGLTVDIGPLDFELRCAILLIKAKKYEYPLSMETAKMIAEKTMDARELEGLLLRLITEAETHGIPQEEAVGRLITNNTFEKIFGGDEVIKNTCSFYNLKPTALKGPKREAGLVRARQVCMYLLKKEAGLTYSEIGNLLGGRDHTTVMYGVSKIEELLLKKSGLSEELLGITGKPSL